MVRGPINLSLCSRPPLLLLATVSFCSVPNVTYVTRNSGGGGDDWQIAPCVLSTCAMRLVKERARAATQLRPCARAHFRILLDYAFCVRLHWPFTRCVDCVKTELEKESERRKHRATDGEGIKKRRERERERRFRGARSIFTEFFLSWDFYLETNPCVWSGRAVLDSSSV